MSEADKQRALFGSDSDKEAAGEGEGKEKEEEEDGKEKKDEDEDEAEADDLSSRLATLEQELQDQKKQTALAEKDAAHVRKTHETYKKQNQTKMKAKNEELAATQKELVDARVVLANQTTTDASGKVRKHPSACVEQLIKLAVDALRSKKAEISAAAVTGAKGPTVYEFNDNGHSI
eukprot:7390897-Prymnesium_polylepis.1